MSVRDLHHSFTPARPFSGPRARLNEAETRKRLMAAAEGMFATTGLTVSLDHLRFEDVILNANVSRSAAYRLFPYKEQFYAELLPRLAAPSLTDIGDLENETRQVAINTLMSRLDDMATAEDRWQALLAVSKVTTEHNFRVLKNSTAWDTYTSLTATINSMPEGDARAKLATALRTTKEDALGLVANSFREMAYPLGYRLRPEYDDDYMLLATVCTAVVEGLGMHSTANGDISRRRVKTFKDASPELTEWTLPAIGFTAILTAMVEPDPEWTPDRLDALRAPASTPGPRTDADR